MDLCIAIRSGRFGPGISLVLAKMMEVAKEIRSGDKKRGAAPAGGRAALWSAGDGWAVLLAAGGCLPFWGPERQGGRARRRGDGLPGMDGRR